VAVEVDACGRSAVVAGRRGGRPSGACRGEP
jgi:hypothetical protein